MFETITAKGILEPEDLINLIGMRGVKIIDSSYVLPDNPLNPYDIFYQKRIPSSQFFSISEISDKTSGLPHMLPSAGQFAQALSDLGIECDDLVIAYGQGNMSMGPARAWWMFKVFGHNQIVVLNGGLKAWEERGGAMENSPPKKPQKTIYKVKHMNNNLVIDINSVALAQRKGARPLLDARPKNRFNGSAPEPRQGLCSGHIPGSLNIPASSLMDMHTEKLLSHKKLQEIFSPFLMEGIAPPILSCGSGITACMLALGLFVIGKSDFSVYDGSWSEWGQRNLKMPVNRLQ